MCHEAKPAATETMMITAMVCMRVRLKFREPPEHQFTDDLYSVTLFRNVFAYIIYIIKEVAEGVK